MAGEKQSSATRFPFRGSGFQCHVSWLQVAWPLWITTCNFLDQGDRQVVEVGQELKTDFKSKCILLPIVSAETDLRSGFASRTSSRGDAMVR